MPGQDEYTEEAYDKYIYMQEMLQMYGTYGKAKVFGKNNDTDGKQVLARNRNPPLESRVYTVEFDDDTFCEYTKNTIVENMYAQIYDEGI